MGDPLACCALVRSFFLFFGIENMFCIRDIVLSMSNNLERELRDVEWELYLLYRAGNIDRVVEARLWSEIESLFKVLGV